MIGTEVPNPKYGSARGRRIRGRQVIRCRGRRFSSRSVLRGGDRGRRTVPSQQRYEYEHCLDFQQGGCTHTRHAQRAGKLLDVSVNERAPPTGRKPGQKKRLHSESGANEKAEAKSSLGRAGRRDLRLPSRWRGRRPTAPMSQSRAQGRRRGHEIEATRGVSPKRGAMHNRAVYMTAMRELHVKSLACHKKAASGEQAPEAASDGAKPRREGTRRREREENPVVVCTGYRSMTLTYQGIRLHVCHAKNCMAPSPRRACRGRASTPSRPSRGLSTRGSRGRRRRAWSS